MNDDDSDDRIRQGTVASNQNDIEFGDKFYGDLETERVIKMKATKIIDEDLTE